MSAALERLQLLATRVPAPKVSGQWFNIRYCPSAAGGEIFNIGVAYLDTERQRIQARLIENLDGFRVLFGEALEEDVRFALDVVRSAFAQAMDQSPVRNVVYGERRFAAGESAQEVLGWLFSSTVSLAGSKQPSIGRKEAAPNNAAVRKAVFDQIRLKADLRADQIIAADPIYWASEGDRRVPLDIPIRGHGLLGSLVSAGQRSKLPLENNLLRSSLDLETAARIYKHDRLGFFVMRPDPVALDGIADATLDEFIDTTCWKLHKHGIHVGVEATPGRLAEDILSWAGV